MNPGLIWDKYKALELWKRVLLIVPVLVAIMLVALYVFMRPNAMRINDDLLDMYDDQLENTLIVSNGKIVELTKEMKKLEKERVKLHEEIKENAQIAHDTDVRIDCANSLDELERIRQEIAERVKRHSE